MFDQGSSGEGLEKAQWSAQPGAEAAQIRRTEGLGNWGGGLMVLGSAQSNTLRVCQSITAHRYAWLRGMGT